MFRIALMTGLVTLAAPVLAQDMEHPAADPQTGQPHAAPPAESMPPAEPMPQSEPQPSMEPETSQTPADQARPATPSEVGAMVESEFPSRDSDGDGSLNQAEFTTWLGELVARSPGESAPPSEEQIASAFAQTDTDGSGSISPAEMAALLARGR